MVVVFCNSFWVVFAKKVRISFPRKCDVNVLKAEMQNMKNIYKNNFN